jgi:hypothetical protein
MVKALKVTMIVYAVILILLGLIFIFVPSLVATMLSLEESPPSTSALAAVVGTSLISACIFFIIAARDPIKNILFVKYAIVFAIFHVFGDLYSVIRGYTAFSDALVGIILHVVFAILFLVFYPWHKAQVVEPPPSLKS